MIVAWFSAGCTSAVACKKALELYGDVEIVYIETGSHHPDNQRFLKDCQDWYQKEIKILKSPYNGVIDVIKRYKFINSAYGAACTKQLKTRVRQQYEYENNVQGQVWGFECSEKEINRAERLKERYSDFEHYFPLIELELNKANALCHLEKAGIRKPKMYELGYHNNNCIGCVKGGMGYWNKIRRDFPDVFNEMARVEQEIGHSCLKHFNGYETMPLFLDQLSPDAGKHFKEIMPECGIFCEQLSLFVV